MLPLVRRRDPEARQESWHILYGDVRVGTIGLRSGVPTDVDQWHWSAGFYPLSHRALREGGIAPNFLRARADFEAAWHRFLPKITKTDLAEYRRERAWTAWKQRMWSWGCRMPTQEASGRSVCYCGAAIDTASMGEHVLSAHLDCAQFVGKSGEG
jgi:hypothetical protein